jgi:hypothetical protein
MEAAWLKSQLGAGRSIESIARETGRDPSTVAYWGRCALCGFDDYAGALQFHHLDPSCKAFALSRHGVTRSLASAREEAARCALLCANCHAMVEAGLRALPEPADISGAGFGPG